MSDLKILKPVDEEKFEQDVNGYRRFFKDVELKNTSAKFEQHCPFPEDSVFHPFIEQARSIAECSDSLLVGSCAGFIAGIIGRNIWFNLAGKKHPNLFCILSGRPGGGKSTAMKLCEAVANSFYDGQTDKVFLSDSTSVQSLFDEFHENPDRIWLCDDGNATLHEWATSIQGAGVSKQFLRLYDCRGMSENYRRNKTEENGSGKRTIPETSLSLIMACTFGALRDNRIQAKDGLRRRFLNYTCSGTDKVIYHPIFPSRDTISHLGKMFSKIKEFRGEVTLSADADKVWCVFSDSNRKRARETDSEELQSLLCEERAHVMKIATIFQAARAAFKAVPWNVIPADVLQMAIEHVSGCFEAAKFIEARESKSAIDEDIEIVMAELSDPYGKFQKILNSDAIQAEKTELTRKFTSNKNSRFSHERFYRKILPEMERRGLMTRKPKQEGERKNIFLFRYDDELN